MNINFNLKESDLLHESHVAEQKISVAHYPGGALDRVERIVSSNLRDNENNHTPSLFVELLKPISTLKNGQYSEQNNDVKASDTGWMEIGRWIKYEEKVIENGNRWSKPQIGLLTIPSLLRVRACLQNGTVLLNVAPKPFEKIIDQILEKWRQDGVLLTGIGVEKIRYLLLKKKNHQITTRTKEIRTAIRRRLLSGSLSALNIADTSNGRLNQSVGELRKLPFGDDRPINGGQLSASTLPIIDDQSIVDERQNSGIDNGGFIDGNPSMRNFSDDVDSSNETPTKKTNISHRRGSAGSILLEKKLQYGTEGVVILVTQAEHIVKSAFAFVRFRSPIAAGDLLEVCVPVRLIIIIITPLSYRNGERSSIEIGRAFAALLTDEVFATVFYRARESTDLCFGIDEFLSSCLVIPPGKWDVRNALLPSDTNVSQLDRRAFAAKAQSELYAIQPTIPFKSVMTHLEAVGLIRTGRLFGGLVTDIKRKWKFYKSDFTDAFMLRNIHRILSTIILTYFALLTNAITFGALAGQMLGAQMGVIEMLLSALVCGTINALFAGQPLNILSTTAPVLLFEHIIFLFCRSYDWNYLTVRWWQGIWTSLFLFIITALDLSALVAFVTRFTQECFTTLASALFIFKAFEAVFAIGVEAPLTYNPEELLRSQCSCVSSRIFTANHTILVKDTFVPQTMFGLDNFTHECLRVDGELVGHQCQFHPDILLFSIMLFFFVFVSIMVLKHLTNCRLFTNRIRRLLSNYSIIITIVLATGIAHLVGLDVPQLHVPVDFKPSFRDRDWIVHPFSGMPFWLYFASIVPAILLCILLFLDQHITTVLINRKDNKLQKGFGYHLDLFVVSFLTMICAVFGLPFVVAGTVLSVTHVLSLKHESTIRAPGERPTLIGTSEQRVTGLIASLLVGASVFLSPILILIPTPILFGVFLYMGCSSLEGQQLIDRLLLFFMQKKSQPDYIYLRLVRISRVHLFTSIQIFCVLVLYAVNAAKEAAILFPLVVAAVTLVRKCLDRIFTDDELVALDERLPTWSNVFTTNSHQHPDIPPIIVHHATSGKNTNNTSENDNNHMEHIDVGYNKNDDSSSSIIAVPSTTAIVTMKSDLRLMTCASLKEPCVY